MDKARKRHRNKQVSGFSLIELIMIVVLLGIISGVTIPLIFEVVNGWQLSVVRNDLSESAKIGMDRMIREIRQINGRDGVMSATAASFQFTDLNGNNITFYLSSGHLMRTVDGASNQLADNLNQLNFTYYDAGGSVIAIPQVSPQSTDIRMIVIDLSFSYAGAQLNIESGVSPRRLQ